MIRKMRKNDILEVTKLALLLWPDHSFADLQQEFETFHKLSKMTHFVALEDKQIVGFSQCQIRKDYVEGTNSSPVGYLEGIYVLPQYRHQGLARKLVEACENWSRSKNCEEFASDCELTNQDSFLFHTSVGFEVANRVICFVKKL